MEQDCWEKLEVLKISDELALRVYKITKDFPKEEIYGNHITIEACCFINTYKHCLPCEKD